MGLRRPAAISRNGGVLRAGLARNVQVWDTHKTRKYVLEAVRLTTKQSNRDRWNDVVRELHRMVPRNRGKVRRYALTIGNVSGALMTVGILLANLDQPRIVQLACYGIVAIGWILGAVVAPAKLLFASQRNWMAWPMVPATIAGIWLIIASLIESWQLATHMNTVPVRFIARFQMFWLTALAVTLVLAVVRWIADGIYESWPPEMRNPNLATGSKKPDAPILAFKSEVRFGTGPANRTKIRFTSAKPTDTGQTPPRTRRPHGKER